MAAQLLPQLRTPSVDVLVMPSPSEPASSSAAERSRGRWWQPPRATWHALHRFAQTRVLEGPVCHDSAARGIAGGSGAGTILHVPASSKTDTEGYVP